MNVPSGGLDVAVDDPERVSFGDRLARLHQEICAHGDPELAASANHRSQILSLQVLHDHEGRAVVERPDVVDVGDVRVLDPHAGAGFAREPGAGPAALAGIGEQELQRDELAAESEMAGFHDDAHPAPAEDARQLVLADDHVADLDGPLVPLRGRLGLQSETVHSRGTVHVGGASAYRGRGRQPRR